MSAIIHPRTYTASELLSQRQSELDELFTVLPTVSANSVEGHYAGRLFSILGLGMLPRFVAAGFYRLMGAPIFNPWRGKSFNKGVGANSWFGVKGLAFGRYTVSNGVSEVDGLPTLLLNYDVPENPALLRRIMGEARQLSDGVVLARMNWKTRAGVYRVLYFTFRKGD